MKILVKDLLRKPVVIDEDASAEDLGLSEPDLGFVCKSPIHVHVKVERAGDNMVLINGTVTLRASIVCGRCLEEVEAGRSQDLSVDLEVTESDESVDLGEEVRQELITSFANVVKCEHLFRGAERDAAHQACRKRQGEGQLKEKPETA